MRLACQDLSVANLPAGHWLPLERKNEVVEAIRSWLETKGIRDRASFFSLPLINAEQVVAESADAKLWSEG
jgi:hypothetical protein